MTISVRAREYVENIYEGFEGTPAEAVAAILSGEANDYSEIDGGFDTSVAWYYRIDGGPEQPIDPELIEAEL